MTITLPRLGSPAPDFEADTTHGRLRLSDFRGSWVLLFSHPADFTPVCTTEFIALAKAQPEFQARHVELLGLSIDSLYAHLGWLEDIRRSFGVTVPFPVIADSNRAVAMLYGMIMPEDGGTETSRCVFVIDGQGTVRAMIYYPLSAGRDIGEILRLIDSLQTTDRCAVATPANWRPGEQAILPAPRTMEDVEARRATNPPQWYYSPTDIK